MVASMPLKPDHRTITDRTRINRKQIRAMNQALEACWFSTSHLLQGQFALSLPGDMGRTSSRSERAAQGRHVSIHDCCTLGVRTVQRP